MWKGTYSNLFDYTIDNKDNYVTSFVKVPFMSAGQEYYLNKSGETIVLKEDRSEESIVKFQ